MEVPAFYRWLSRQYPTVKCVEKKSDDGTGKWVPENASLPNPNGVEFDNLYLEMNCIIHHCAHPKDKPLPKNEEEMMIGLFECIDRLFNIARPRKVLYMALDGVAPRAKLNQQRSRRFIASKEAGHFDTNCITPGTPFMERLSCYLHNYIHDRLNNNPAWKNIKVFLSDANVPGEGQHKILDHIHKQRAQPDHDPNTQHVLCGTEAALIMLGLATHEHNFTIICEKTDMTLDGEIEFIFVRLSALKENLKKSLDMPELQYAYDFERLIDDWLFLCLFVSNDFLPQVPCFENNENAIDRLIEFYKKCVSSTGGYLTNSGQIDLYRFQRILRDLAFVEDEIFKSCRDLLFRDRDKPNKRLKNSHGWPQYNSTHAHGENSSDNTLVGTTALKLVGNRSEIVSNAQQELSNLRMVACSSGSKNALETMLRPAGGGGSGAKRKLNFGEDSNEAQKDEDFRDNYYKTKFGVVADNVLFRYSVTVEYVRGLCWVLKYYYQGCASWDWYYPYHYAPFASDFFDISGLEMTFKKGSKPLNPLEQLMAVLPAASSSHVPAPLAVLMSDPSSAIIDFYPKDFKIKLNGMKFAREGVAILPFVDKRRLIEAVQPLYKHLTAAEIKRNKLGDDRLYITNSSPGYKLFEGLYKNNTARDVEVPISIQDVQGVVLVADECVDIGKSVAYPIFGLHISDNKVWTVRYRNVYNKKNDFMQNFQQDSLGGAGQVHIAPSQQYRGGGNERIFSTILNWWRDLRSKLFN